MTELAATRTPITASQVAAMIASLWPSVIGGTPTQEAVATLTTQVDVETGWNACWNWNVGNIVPSGGSDYIVIHDSSGTPIQLRAFASLQDGVTTFLSLLNTRYSAALASAASGDLDGYASNLKAQGYYGASEASYLALLQARYPTDAAAAANATASLPSGSGGGNSTPSSSLLSNAVIAVVGGLAIGAAAHYLLPPDIGRARQRRRRAA